jgi:hypothetical protein
VKHAHFTIVKPTKRHGLGRNIPQAPTEVLERLCLAIVRSSPFAGSAGVSPIPISYAGRTQSQSKLHVIRAFT